MVLLATTAIIAGSGSPAGAELQPSSDENPGGFYSFTIDHTLHDYDAVSYNAKSVLRYTSDTISEPDRWFFVGEHILCVDSEYQAEVEMEGIQSGPDWVIVKVTTRTFDGCSNDVEGQIDETVAALKWHLTDPADNVTVITHRPADRDLTSTLELDLAWEPVDADTSFVPVVEVAAIAYIYDEDWWLWEPAADDRGIAQVTARREMVTGGTIRELFDLNMCVGSEIRVEYNVSARLNSQGEAEVTSDADMFEGAHCGTNDHEVAHDFIQVLQEPGQSSERSIRMEAGDDWTIITRDYHYYELGRGEGNDPRTSLPA